MTFELDADGAARRAAADAVASASAGAAALADAAAEVPAAERAALRAVLPHRPAAALADWVVALESLAAVSPALSVAVAGEALGAPAVTPSAQWPGLRGVDVDGLRAALATDTAWHLAVTAVLVGAGRGAVAAGVAALKVAGRAAAAAQPAVADAATAVDASRLLLWDAAGHHAAEPAARVARGLARLQALDAVTTAFVAAERACGAEAFRPGAPLERLRRDAATVAQVLGDRATEIAAVAGITLPA